MDYSIIIPYHSNEYFLKLCLSSLNRTLPEDVEIVVVANNKNLEREFPQIDEKKIRVIKIKQNIGYSQAINYGAQEANGKYLIFADSDTIFTYKNWFQNLTSIYRSNNRIGIASSKLVNLYTNRIIDFGMALSRCNNAHVFMDRPINSPIVSKNRKVQMACSANMIIEKDLFMKMGMMDTELLNFYQDNDLCLRLKDFDKECWVVSDSIVYHKGSSTKINRDPYRADVKGLYLAKNVNRMEQDLHLYFDTNLSYAIEKNQSIKTNGKYLLIDISTVADFDWFQNLIREHFNLYDTYDFKFEKRDSTHISLIDLLGSNILTLSLPIIYFVDRYISLLNNALWTILRDCSHDIVIDRNLNIIPFNQLINE